MGIRGSLETGSDAAEQGGGLVYNAPTNPVYVHMDVADDLAGRTILRRRANLRLRDLMARGSLIRAKSTRGNTNRGWLRTPLGGQHGSQFYLWWTRTELPPFEQRELRGEFEHSIWVRAVRHHDDHDRLPFGDIGSYYPFEQADAIDDDLFSEQPWTDAQVRVFESRDNVNVVYGHPGSGKTTTLLKVVEDCHRQRVLFSTLSRELTSVALEYINVMAPVGTEVLAYDYLSLLSLLSRRDVSRLSPSAAVRNFRRVLRLLHLRHDQVGPWRGEEEALYAEIRSVMLGRAVPGEPDSRLMANGMSRLNGNAYRDLRSRRGGIGDDAVSSVLQVMRALESDADIAGLFPELAAACSALKHLRESGVPRRLGGLDRVLFDEVQDLTLLEAKVVVELVSALRGAYRQPPVLYLAGDAGQTVRHSGFEWGWLNSLLYRSLRKPAEFELDRKLRTPRRISRVIENSLTLYKQLERGDRPGNQRREVFDDESDGQVCYVEVVDVDAAISLLETFVDADVIRVVTAGSEIPGWVPLHLRSFVLTPVMVKGLEYSNICVLEPGAAMSRVTQSHGSSSERLAGHRNRTVIDNLRVALSRATDVLVFVDVAPTDQMRALSKELLGDDAVSLSADELMTDVLNDEITSRERVETRLRDAASLLDVEPALAWHRAVQAQLLHDRADERLGERVDRTVVRVAARFLVDGVPEGVDARQVKDRASVAFASLEEPLEHAVFDELAAWTEDRASSPIPLLRLMQGVDTEMEWLRSALTSIHQTLLAAVRSAASDIKEAEAFSERVEEWLELLAFSGETDRSAAIDEVRELRVRAFGALYDGRRTESATKMLNLLPLYLVELMAQEAAVADERSKAIFLFEFLGMPDEVRRVVEDEINEHVEAMLEHLMCDDNVNVVAEANGVLALDRNNPVALHCRAMAYMNMNELSKALKDVNVELRLLAGSPESSDAMVLKGSVLHGMGSRVIEILACYRKALEIDPDNLQAHKALAHLQRGEGEIEASIVSWKKIVREYPAECEGASLELAEIYREDLDDSGRALEVLSAALKEYPISKRLRMARVEVFERLEDEEGIVSEMECLADMYPDDRGILWRLARDYAVNGKVDEAVELCERLVVMDPDDYAVHRNFGAIYETLYHNTDKKPFLTKAIRQVNIALGQRGDVKDSVQAELYFFRAKVYRRRRYSGDKAKCFYDSERSRKCDPSVMRHVTKTSGWW